MGEKHPLILYKIKYICSFVCACVCTQFITLFFSPQTREQLQADLLRCQAKIEDLEKALIEKGQVKGSLNVLCHIIFSLACSGALAIFIACWCVSVTDAA